MRPIKDWLRRKPKLPKEPLLAKCGHETRLKGEVQAFGESRTMNMPRNAEGTTNYCLDCIGKMTIQCAWCGEPIFIGDAVTLYTPEGPRDFDGAYSGQKELGFVKDSDLGFKRPHFAVVYKKKPLQLVGCLRINCADSGADRSGFWIPGPDSKGMVYRVMNAFEMVVADMGEGKGGGAVVINDLLNPRTARPHKEGSLDLPIGRNLP